MQTKSWDKRVTTSLFAMYCVDAWLMYKGCTSASEKDTPKLSQQEFYCQLAEELIDNNQERIRTRKRPRSCGEFDSPQSYASRPSVPVLRATKRRKTGTGGKLPNSALKVDVVSVLKDVLRLYARHVKTS